MRSGAYLICLFSERMQPWLQQQAPGSIRCVGATHQAARVRGGANSAPALSCSGSLFVAVPLTLC